MKKRLTLIVFSALVFSSLLFSFCWALHDDESVKKGGAWDSEDISRDKPRGPAEKGKIDESLDKAFKKSPLLIPPLSGAEGKEQEPPSSGSGSVQERVLSSNEWSYFKGTVEPPQHWMQRNIDDTLWEKGRAGFGYGAGTHATQLTEMKGAYKTIYVRQTHYVRDYKKVTRMVMSVVCDGPFIAYLNGIEVIRSRRPQSGELFDLSGLIHELDNGNNVFAMQCSNDDINSEVFSFIPFFEIHMGTEQTNQHFH